MLSLPIPARLLLIREPALVSLVLRAFVRRIFAWQRRVARGMGIQRARSAAVTFIQRGGGALNINPHFHTVVPDGVFDARADGSVRCVPLLAPSDADVASICGPVARRVGRLLQGRDDAFLEDAEPAAGALAPTLPLALPPGPSAIPRPEWEHPGEGSRPRSRRCASVD